MVVNITQRDVDEALRLSPARGHLHFFANPVAIAYSREMIVDYCAVTLEYVHVCSPKSFTEYMQRILPSAQKALVDWKNFRTMRLGPLNVY